MQMSINHDVSFNQNDSLAVINVGCGRIDSFLFLFSLSFAGVDVFSFSLERLCSIELQVGSVPSLNATSSMMAAKTPAIRQLLLLSLFLDLDLDLDSDLIPSELYNRIENVLGRRGGSLRTLDMATVKSSFSCPPVSNSIRLMAFYGWMITLIQLQLVQL